MFHIQTDGFFLISNVLVYTCFRHRHMVLGKWNKMSLIEVTDHEVHHNTKYKLLERKMMYMFNMAIFWFGKIPKRGLVECSYLWPHQDCIKIRKISLHTQVSNTFDFKLIGIQKQFSHKGYLFCQCTKYLWLLMSDRVRIALFWWKGNVDMLISLTKIKKTHFS